MCGRTQTRAPSPPRLTSPDILSAHSQDAARTAIVAARCSFRAGTAGACDPLKIDATTGDELAKPERRPVAKLVLRGALRPVGFRSIESYEAESLPSNANRVAIQHLDLAGLNWSGIRDRNEECEKEADATNHGYGWSVKLLPAMVAATKAANKISDSVTSSLPPLALCERSFQVGDYCSGNVW
jgi:hypothetical protein